MTKLAFTHLPNLTIISFLTFAVLRFLRLFTFRRTRWRLILPIFLIIAALKYYPQASSALNNRGPMPVAATQWAPAPIKASPEVDRVEATVARVIDGDTLTVGIGGQEETIRLLLVDTPETTHPSKPIQPLGEEASQFVAELLPPGTKVEMELDVSERDRYGRLLAYVYIGGDSLQEMLLEQGLARVAAYPPNIRYVDRYKEIEARAQKQGIGIWSIENYVTESGFNW